MIPIRSGYIPKEVTYCISKPREIYNATGEPNGKRSRAFISDSTNSATTETAFVKSGRGTKVTKPNDPIEGLRIFGYEYKTTNTNMWICLDSEDRALDLGEDVLLEIIKTVGISPGGYINGKYVWARVGSGNMKLVRVDSPLHVGLLAASQRKQSTSIKKKNIVAGHVYQQKNGEVFLYVGNCYGYRPNDIGSNNNYLNNPAYKRWYDWVQITKNKDSWLKEIYLRQWKNLEQPPHPKRIEVTYTKFSSPLWLKLAWDDTKTPEQNLQILENGKETILMTSYRSSESLGWVKFNCVYYCHLIDDKKVVFDFGKLEISNIYEQIRELALVELVENLKKEEDKLKNATHYEYHLNDRIIKERNRLITVGHFLPCGTLNPEGQEMDPSYDYWISEIISREPA